MSVAGPAADLGRSCRSSCSLGDAARTCLVEAKVKKAAGARLTSNGLNSTLRTRRCFALPPPPHTPQEGRKEGQERAACASAGHDVTMTFSCSVDGRQGGESSTTASSTRVGLRRSCKKYVVPYTDARSSVGRGGGSTASLLQHASLCCKLQCTRESCQIRE